MNAPFLDGLPIYAAPSCCPCPFCGSASVFSESPSYGRSKWRVVCDDCGAEGPPVGQAQSFNTAADQPCIEAWNNRALGVVRVRDRVGSIAL